MAPPQPSGSGGETAAVVGGAGAVAPHIPASIPVAAAAARTKASDFRVIRILGKGDVGRVYLVEHIATRELYAMKVVSKVDVLQRKRFRRLHTEWSVLQEHDHPFVAKLYWSFQSRTKHYFVMEYCAGGEFFRFLQRQKEGRVSESAARFYAAEVLLALEHLHINGLVYRDIKPENILMHASGHLILTDFDLSKKTKTTLRVIGGDPDSPAAAEPEGIPLQEKGRSGSIASESAASASSAASGATSCSSATAAGASSCESPVSPALEGIAFTEADLLPQQHRPFSPPEADGAAPATSSPTKVRSRSDPFPLGVGASPLSPGVVVGAAEQQQQQQAPPRAVPRRPRGDSSIVKVKGKKMRLNIVADAECGCPSFVGTAEYIPPEVVSREGGPDGRPAASDVHAIDWWGFGVLLYEMLYGRTPFRGSSEAETFKNIAKQKGADGGRLHFPAQPVVSDAGKKLIRSLLNPDPEKRLGTSRGAAEIKAHRWFKGVAFPLIRNEAPPLQPFITLPGGSSSSMGSSGAGGGSLMASPGLSPAKPAAAAKLLLSRVVSPDTSALPLQGSGGIGLAAGRRHSSSSGGAYDGVLSDTDPSDFGEDPEVQRLLREMYRYEARRARRHPDEAGAAGLPPSHAAPSSGGAARLADPFLSLAYFEHAVQPNGRKYASPAARLHESASTAPTQNCVGFGSAPDSLLMCGEGVAGSAPLCPQPAELHEGVGLASLGSVVESIPTTTPNACALRPAGGVGGDAVPAMHCPGGAFAEGCDDAAPEAGGCATTGPTPAPAGIADSFAAPSCAAQSSAGDTPDDASRSLAPPLGSKHQSRSFSQRIKAALFR